MFVFKSFVYTHTHSSSDRFYLIGGVFPVAGIVAVVGLLCAVLVALTSSNDKPPIYHCVSVWEYVYTSMQCFDSGESKGI